MRKRLTALLLGTALLLSGCGVSFDITEKDLRVYAESMDGTFTEEEVDEGTVPGHRENEASGVEESYTVETDDVLIHHYVMHNLADAKEWYDDTRAGLSEYATEVLASENVTGGDCAVTRKSMYYRILYYGNDALYLEGEKEAVIDALRSLGVKTDSIDGREAMKEAKELLGRIGDSLSREDTESTETEQAGTSTGQ